MTKSWLAVPTSFNSSTPCGDLGNVEVTNSCARQHVAMNFCSSKVAHNIMNFANSSKKYTYQ